MSFLRFSVVTFLMAQCSYCSEDVTVDFYQIVKETLGFEVFQWDGYHSNVIEQGCFSAAESFNNSDLVGAKSTRINEIGNLMEQFVLRGFHKNNIDCEMPLTTEGRVTSSGYPDLKMTVEDRIYYIEVKVFSSHTRNSAFRTFYYSKNKEPKIDEDAFHLLVGFEIFKNSDDKYEILGFDIFDLRNLPCKVKVEYNSSNKTMYGDQFGFRRSLKLKSQ